MKEIAKYAVIGSPDWFLSGIVSVSSWRDDPTGISAFLAFSSKPYIHIYRLSFESHIKPQGSFDLSYVGQIQAHHERISGVAFYNVTDSNIPGLISSGLDGLVRHWRYVDEDWALANELNVHSVQDGLDPTAIATCYHTDCICLSLIGTNKGSLIVWNESLIQNRSNFISRRFENESVVHCAWENSVFVPGSTRIAVGYKKGIVGIYSYKLSDVTSASNLTQLSRFYAHEKDICHVVWKPTSNQTSETNSVDLLTTGRDQMIKIWTVSNSWCCASAKIPGKSRKLDCTLTNSSSKRNANKTSSTGSPWISACWNPKQTDDPNTISIFCSGLHGELLHWDGKDPPTNVKSNSQGHTMIVFSIVAVSQSPGYFVTISQDRLAVIWRADDQGLVSSVSKIPTLPAGVMALTQAAYGTCPLIGGLSDGSLIIWRMHYSFTNNPDSSGDGISKDKLLFVYPRGQQSSAITAVACHPMPQFENILVYGTESGIVEITDIGKLQKGTHKKSQSQPYSFGSTVYRVAWGPLLFENLRSKKSNQDFNNIATEKSSLTIEEQSKSSQNESITSDENIDLSDTIPDNAQMNTKNKSNEGSRFPYYVYSACKGKIFLHLGSNRPPIDVSCHFPQPFGISKEDWTTIVRSDICFHSITENDSNHSETSNIIASRFSHLVAVGYRSGDVDIYAQLCSNDIDCGNLIFVCRLSMHSKGINCICWSRSNYWIAIGSNENFITVSDLSTLLIDASKKMDSPTSLVQLSTCFARLEGHCNRITSLDWSPHDPYLLLSSSFDGTANVWKVCDNKQHNQSYAVSNFRAHRLRLFTCLWSRLEPDLAFTGGELCHFFGWKPSEQSYKLPPNSRRYRPPPIKRLTQPDVVPQIVDTNVPNQPQESDSINSELICQSNELSTIVHESKPNDAQINRDTKKVQPNIGVCTPTKIGSTSSGEKRKRPALFPNFLQPFNLDCCKLDVNLSPPIHLSARLTQILQASQYYYNGIETSYPDKTLLFLLPETPDTRSYVVDYIKQEATSHFETYKSNHKPGSLTHLDAHCMLMLWLGKISRLSNLIITENHMPFWLLLAIELSKSNSFACSFSEQHQSIDLLGEKVKEIVSNSQDILVASTLLVCAGRTPEAVELLLRHDKCKEALIMARSRLDPANAWDVVVRSVNRLDERRLSAELPYIKILHSIGTKDWTQVRALIRRELGLLAARPNKEIDLIAWLWIEISFLLDESSEHLLIHSCLRLASLGLTSGFRYFSSQPEYYDHWHMAFAKLSTTLPQSIGFSLCLLLFKLGQLICSLLNSPGQNHLDCQLESIDCSPNCLFHLIKFSTDRQPSSQWEICLTNLCIDFMICHLVLRYNQTKSEVITYTEYFDRFKQSAEDCIHIKPDTCHLIRTLSTILMNCKSDVYSAIETYLSVK